MQTKKRGGSRLDTSNTAKPRKRGKVFIVILGVLVVIMVGVIVFHQLWVKPPSVPSLDGDDGTAFHSPEFNEDDARLDVGRTAPEGVTDDDRKKDFYTILIIGVDGGVNTDTIMVASYDGVNKEANLISFPRDSLVNVKRKVKKINAAYPAGTLNGGGQAGGVAQLKREIKTIIGFIPDFYVVIDLNAFVKIIDTVGGVEIDVPYDMKYYDPTQNLNINIAKGLQTLSGADALKFARYRKGSKGYKTISDYERIENQQAVITALLGKVINPVNLLKIPEFITIFSENVYTDLSAGSLAWFGEQVVKLRGSDALSTYTVPTSGSSGSPNWYEYMDSDGILELVNRTVNPYSVAIKPEDVDIINKVP